MPNDKPTNQSQSATAVHTSPHIEAALNRLGELADYVYTDVVDNPKKPGSKAHERYSLIRPGMSVREVVHTTFKKLREAEAKRVFEDLKWDMDKQRHFYRLVRPS